jgi:chaperonin GroES
MKIVPTGNRVFVTQEAAKDMTEGGLIIPEMAKERPRKGVVVAVGIGTREEPMTVKVGQTVFFSKGAGREIIIDDQEYLELREPDISAYGE